MCVLLLLGCCAPDDQGVRCGIRTQGDAGRPLSISRDNDGRRDLRSDLVRVGSDPLVPALNRDGLIPSAIPMKFMDPASNS